MRPASDITSGERSMGRKMCQPGICFSMFQGNQKNSAAHVPHSPSQSQPGIKALYLTRILRCSWSLSSSPVDSETVHGGCRAVIGGCCFKAASPGLSLELTQTTSYSVIVVKQLNFLWRPLRCFTSPERSILLGFLSSLNSSDQALRGQRQL